MSVTVRPYVNGGWEVDIRVQLPDGSVIRERKKLAYGGAVSLVVTVDKKSGVLAGEPKLSFQGVAGVDLTNGVVGSARQAITEAVEAMTKAQITDTNLLQENLRVHLKRFLQKEIGTKPVIVTTIVEV